MSYHADTRPRWAGNAVDDLLSHVLALPPARLRQFFDRLVGRKEVVAVGWHVAEKRLSPRPNAGRDREMTRLHDGGLSYADIAHARNMTRSAVAKAVQRCRRRRDSESVSTPNGDYTFSGGRTNA